MQPHSLERAGRSRSVFTGLASSNPVRVIAALTLAILLGIAIAQSSSDMLANAAARIEAIGTLWVNAIRMTVVPLVMSILISSVASRTTQASFGRTGVRAVLLFVGLLIASAVFVMLLAPKVLAWLPFDVDAIALPAGADTPIAAAAPLSLERWLIDLIPVNPIRAAVDGAMLPIVVFSFLFGLASTRVPGVLRRPIVQFFSAMGATLLVLVDSIVRLAPIGVFCLVLPLTARLGVATAGALASFIATMGIVIAAEIIALYALAMMAGNISIAKFARAALPAQTVALSSRSSLAALPALIEGARHGLNSQPEVYGFVIPLAVSTFKLTWPVSAIVGALFLGRLYGVELDTAALATIAATSIVLSFSSPGIPSASLLVLAPLFASVGLPVQGIGILIALDAIPDIFKTTANVTGDLAVAAVLGRQASVESQPCGEVATQM